MEYYKERSDGLLQSMKDSNNPEEAKAATDEMVSVMDQKQEIKKRIENNEITIEKNSHFKRVSDEWLFYSFTQPFFCPYGEATEKSPIKIEVYSDSRTCDSCGQEVEWLFDGNKFFVEVDPCPKENHEFSVELNVPSGEIVFANDFRSEFPVYGSRNVNACFERELTSKDYEKIGMVHLSVGNTCPAIAYDPEGKLVLGSFYDEETNDIIKGYKRLGGIITDLWWISAVDSEELIKRGYKDDGRGVDHISVEPGVYRFTHHYEDLDEDRSGVYTSIEWIRKPDPIKDYSTDDELVTLGQYIHNSFTKFESLYGGSGQGVIDHICIVIGNGVDWHKNGFPMDDPDQLGWEGSVEIPVLDERYHWYPSLCQYSAIHQAAHGEIPVNAEYQKLMLDVATCIVIHGIKGESEGEFQKKMLEEYGVKGKRSEEQEADIEKEFREKMMEYLGLLIERFPEAAEDRHKLTFGNGTYKHH